MRGDRDHGMSDPALQRTIRRSTATLVLSITLLVFVAERYLTVQGFGATETGTHYLSVLLFAGAGLYLVGSYGLSLLSALEGEA